MKAVIKDFLPPLLVPLIGKLWPRIKFKGNYQSWKSAVDAAGGYDSFEILNCVREAGLKVKRGDAVFERDAVCFYKEEYRWPVLSCLLNIAVQNRNQLHVIDFGGALGSSYYQHRKMLASISELHWCVIEQPNFVQCGQKEFQDEILTFENSMEDAARDAGADVVLLSGVLPYLEKPYEILQQVASLGIPYILIDRTPYHNKEQDRLTVQQVPKRIYKASYPAWFFSEQKFLKFVDEIGYSVVAEFDSFDSPNVGSNYKGFFLKKIEAND